MAESPQAKASQIGSAAKLSSAKVATGAEVSSGNGARSELGIKVSGAIESACKAVISAADELTEMDRITGDGDLGSSMERAAKAVLEHLASYPLDDIAATLRALAHTVRRELGGSSGPLYGVLLLRCGTVLEGSVSVEISQWAEALTQGSQAISELGGAKPGDRTMLDALHPFLTTLKEAPSIEPPREVMRAAVEAAERGAEATAGMKPRVGRSSYLGDRVLGHPDPGAKALAILLRAVYTALFAD